MKKIILMTCALISFSACSQETRQDLGLANVAPDEFSVITRAPLSVPPEYALRPPRPGASRPMEISTRDTARKTIFGTDDLNQSGDVVEDKNSESFLDKVGVNSADPNIRDVIDSERSQGVEDNRATAEKLLFWRDKKEDEGTPIDPKEELDRLKNEGVINIKKRNEEIISP